MDNDSFSILLRKAFGHEDRWGGKDFLHLYPLCRHRLDAQCPAYLCRLLPTKHLWCSFRLMHKNFTVRFGQELQVPGWGFCASFHLVPDSTHLCIFTFCGVWPATLSVQVTQKLMQTALHCWFPVTTGNAKGLWPNINIWWAGNKNRLQKT